MEKNQEKLLKLAQNAAQNAYAPYSNFKVGACVMFDDGSTYTGCNVENASYGLSLCAERSALSTAVAGGTHKGLVAVAIYSPNAELCYPCGACRQWIAEFSTDATIIVQNGEGFREFSIQELIPYSFKL
jgi:cytidine deaminase